MNVNGLSGQVKLGYETVAELGAWQLYIPDVAGDASRRGAAEVTRIVSTFWFEHGTGFTVTLDFGRRGLGGECTHFDWNGDKLHFQFIDERGKK